MGEVVIREARPGDHEVMQELTFSAYLEYASFIPPDAWELYKQDMVAAISDPSAQGFVAEQDGLVVGSVLLFKGGSVVENPFGEPIKFEHPEIRLLAVPPDRRGQGIAKALVAECIGRAGASGARAITLHTADMMATAMRMYEGMGFVRYPEIDLIPEPGVVIKGYILRIRKD